MIKIYILEHYLRRKNNEKDKNMSKYNRLLYSSVFSKTYLTVEAKIIIFSNVVINIRK